MDHPSSLMRPITFKDFSEKDEVLAQIELEAQTPLPPPFDNLAAEPRMAPLSDTAREKYECGLDDTIAVNIPKPKSKEEEDRRAVLPQRAQPHRLTRFG